MSNTSFLRSKYLYWIYAKLRTNLQKYIDDTFDATEIIPYLWVGGISSPTNKQNMKSHNIKMIVSAHLGASALYPYDFEYQKVDLLDVDDENIWSSFERLLPRIRDVLNNKKGVLVHCMHGASRSVTIVAAYLMKYHKMKAKDSLIYMKSKRDVVNPNK